MARLKRHIPTSVILAILVHVLAVILLIVGFQMGTKPRGLVAPEMPSVKASVIDGRELERRKEAQQRAEELKRQQALEAQRRADEEKRRLEEKNRLAEQARRQAELKKEQERKRQEEERQRAEELKRQQAEEAKKRKQEEQRRAEEARRQAELKKEQERKHQEEERRRAEEAKRQVELKKEQERKRREAERRAEQKRLAAILEEEEAALKAADERQRQAAYNRKLKVLTDRYRDAISSKIQGLWRKPLNAPRGAYCYVYVRQTPGGFVQKVQVQQCTGDEDFRRSVEAAVWKADPLPAPPDPAVFDRELRFKFYPEG
jgi:colicin import membrane protein